MKRQRLIRNILITVCLLVLVWLFIHTLCTEVVVDERYQSRFFATWMSLVPAVVAIIMALVTKEVFFSLLLGSVAGALLYANSDLELAFQTMLFGKNDEGKGVGLVTKLATPGNMGILVFLVLLGILVALMNKAGGSAAFGRWASGHIRTRVGAQLATMTLGILIFVDDYFNCLTVGSVMRPVTDSHKVSRAKLAYLIDSTAAPICIIAPISSWAAAVTSSVPEGAEINGFQVFLNTIPYNFYAVLTIVMMLYIIIRRLDYGPMKRHEANALRGDLFTTGRRAEEKDEEVNPRGRVMDLVLPVVVLIFGCIIGMVYTGGFFSGAPFIEAFAGANASEGLVYGAFIALIFTFFYYMYRDIISIKDFGECISQGFTSMVAPIMILALAWTLSGMTGLLGADVFVAKLVESTAGALQSLLPAFVFVAALGLAFATGSSWGAFGILIPIVLGVFGSGEMMVMSIAACLAGAVCGDHCSPISDTTIMASAGARSDHVNHVSTQIPYALTVAGVSLVSYIIAGFIENALISLGISVALMIVTLFAIERKVGRRKDASEEEESAEQAVNDSPGK